MADTWNKHVADHIYDYDLKDGSIKKQSADNTKNTIVDHDGSGDYEHRKNRSPGESNLEVLGY